MNATLRDVAARADDFLDGLAGLPVLETRKDFSVEARYRAQVWELDVPVPPQLESDEDVRAVEEAFHATHERIFAVREPGQYLECLLWKARATAVLEKPTIRPRELPAEPGDAASTDTAYFKETGLRPVPRYDGESLSVGTRIEGPAIIREPTTTIVVYPGSAAVVTGLGNYVLELTTEQRDGSVEQRRAGARAVSSFDPVTLAVIANRLDSIVREMENTLLRTGRSAVLNMARDFSCALITADNRLLASAEGLPVHVIGMEFLAEAVTDLHADLTEGDAFLHNDPYLGNTHPADHVILVPVFWEGRHVFTAAAKAHQADCGNAQPTTYMPYARDVYEEGSLIFPAVRVQRDYEDIEDVIRMCRRRIRVPDQWYGDYLAMVGAARIGEARLKEVCARGTERRRSRSSSRSGSTTRSGASRTSSRRMPAGTIVGDGDARPVRPGAGRHPDPGLDHDRSRGRDDRGRPDRQHRLPARRRQRVADVRHEQLHDRDLQLDRPRHPSQRGDLSSREGEAARELRRRHPAVSAFVLGGDDERRRAPRGDHPADDRRRLGRLRARRGRVRDRPRLRGRLRDGLAQGGRPYVNQKFLGSQGGPARAGVRRLGDVRQRRHQRPDVP